MQRLNMKPGTRSSCVSSAVYSKWTVKIGVSLWEPSTAYTQLNPQLVQYCRMEKLQDVLWEVSVGLSVPEPASYVRTLLNLPEVASIVKSFDGEGNGVIRSCCTLCHGVGAHKIEWTIENTFQRREFFTLLSKSLGITSEEFKFYEDDEDMIDLCCSCTAHLQTLTSLFRQLKQVEESFRSEAVSLKTSIVKGVGPPSQKSWNFLREHVVTSYLGMSTKVANVEEIQGNTQELGEIVSPLGPSGTYGIDIDTVDDFEITDNSTGDDVKYFVDGNSELDDSEDGSLYKDRSSKQRLRRKMSSERKSTRGGGRTRHEVWVHFNVSYEGKWKVAECRKCGKSFKCPQADRLVKHVEKCSDSINIKRREVEVSVSPTNNVDKVATD